MSLVCNIYKSLSRPLQHPVRGVQKLMRNGISQYFSSLAAKVEKQDVKEIIIPTKEVKRFIIDCLHKVNTPKHHAEQLANVLIAADCRGHYSHGLNRLDIYLHDVSSGLCDSKAKPKIIKETAATAYVDGQNGLGPVVGNFCMDLAIKKCKEVGVGWVVAKGSNHYGIAGWYSLQALDHKMIGLSFTNTSPILVPTRSNNAGLGTNPISVASQGKNKNDQFVLDMATTAVAVGKIELQKRKGERIPSGWAQDSKGEITTDAIEAMKVCHLLPLGGSEITSGYKGYGLSLMVELFCGILAGSAYGPRIRNWTSGTVPANLGQCFISLDPSCFAPNFEERLSDLLNYLRNMEPVDKSKSVLVAGDPEKEYMKKVDRIGGLSYHENQILASEQMAENLGVVPMQPLVKDSRPPHHGKSHVELHIPPST